MIKFEVEDDNTVLKIYIIFFLFCFVEVVVINAKENTEIGF